MGLEGIRLRFAVNRKRFDEATSIEERLRLLEISRQILEEAEEKFKEFRRATGNHPRRSLQIPHGKNDFRVCRVLVHCALITIKSFDNLRTAKSYMNRIAARAPGSYVVFSHKSGQVLAKVVRQAA